MKQIAIGDDSLGWTVLHGRAVAAPFRSAACFFTSSPEHVVHEKIEIFLSGTPSEIDSALSTLQLIRLRAIEYDLGSYLYPQFLRFQQTSAITYYYTAIRHIWIEVGSKTYLTRQTGSALVILHYTRDNYFESAYKPLTLTDINDVDYTTGITLKNHFDLDPNHYNTFLVKPTAFSTELPAPLRIQIENTYAPSSIDDIYIGTYHHKTLYAHRCFYALYSDLTGGSAVVNAAAIGGSYRTVTWTSAAYTSTFNWSIVADDIYRLDGRWYRPIVHLFAAHAYTDLHFRLKLHQSTNILQVCDPIYADPNYQYLVFPPLQIPPPHLLREKPPNALEIELFALKEDGTVATVTVDQITLLPLDPSVFLDGFFGVVQNETLILDCSRDLVSTRQLASQYETISHNIKGGPLTLFPGEFNRLIFIVANSAHVVDIPRTINVIAYYRKRIRFV